MDLSKIKPEILKKYTEHKAFLSKLDCWSYIQEVRFMSFRTSQTGFRYIQGNENLDIIDQHVSSGRLAVYLRVEPIKLDDFALEVIEIVQDIDIKSNDIFFSSATFEIKSDFNTKNSLGTKDLRIFDARLQGNKLLLKIETQGNEYMELMRTF